MGAIVSNIWNSFKTVLVIVLVLWLILAVGMIVPLEGFGIRPRTVTGLPGIIFAPFIHASIGHLIANSVSLLVLGSVFLVMERKLPALIAALIILLGGLGTWLIGRSAYTHIGASGVIYGVLGYLLAMGIFARNVKVLLVSVAVFVLYGGMVWGIFPADGFVSWESHLCGFIAGVFAAKLYAGRGRE